MAATKFGVIYATGSAMLRRYAYPSNDAELTSKLCGAGESLVLVSRGPYVSTAAWQAAINAAVTAAAGKAPSNPNCCVLDGTNTVAALIKADAAIDTLPGKTLVQAYANIPIGSTYDPNTTLFTAPGYTIPAFAGNARAPASNAITVPPTVIPRP